MSRIFYGPLRKQHSSTIVSMVLRISQDSPLIHGAEEGNELVAQFLVSRGVFLDIEKNIGLHFGFSLEILAYSWTKIRGPKFSCTQNNSSE